MRALLTTGLLVLASAANAAAPAKPAPPLTDYERGKCQEVATISQSIMAARQKGVPMAQVLDVFQKAGVGPLITSIQAIAQDAYSRPQPTAEVDRQKAVADFQNEAYASCQKAWDLAKQPAK